MTSVLQEGGSNQDLAALLTEELGEGFSVFVVEDFVVIGHPTLGLAAVVQGDEMKAVKASDRLNAIAEKAGVIYPSMHFAVAKGGATQWVVSPSAIGPSILRAMAMASTNRPLFSQEALSRIAITISQAPLPEEETILDWRIMRTIEACVDHALGGRQSFVRGLEIDPADVAGPKFLLPALLLGAAKIWTLPVIASRGSGGFLVRMKRDEETILGYRVTDIEISSPLLLFLPVVNVVRTSFVGSECSFDLLVDDFSRFLRDNRYNASGIDDLDVKVATST